MQPNNIPAWNESGAALLRKYLESDSGQIFLLQLTAQRPSLLVNSSDVNAVALKSQEVAGFEKCINAIFFLATKPENDQQLPQDNFPPLDADDAWPEDLQHKPETKKAN